MSYHEEPFESDETNATQKAHIRNAVEMYRNAFDDLIKNGFDIFRSDPPSTKIICEFISCDGEKTVGALIGRYDGHPVIFDVVMGELCFMRPVLWKKSDDWEYPDATY